MNKPNFWALRHYALQRALQRVRKRPLTFVFSVVAAAAALLTPVLCILVSQQPWPLHLNVAPELSVFVELDTRSPELKALTAQLEQLDAAQQVRLIPRDEALTHLAAHEGLLPPPVFKANPLPDVLIVQLRADIHAEMIDTLATQIRKWNHVDTVVADTGWYRKWQHWRTLSHGVVSIIVGIAAILLVWVVALAVRLQATADENEIELLALVGADAPFMRRPYVYLGTLTLVLAMGLALASAHMLMQQAAPHLSALLGQYGLTLNWTPPSMVTALSLLAGAGLVGGLIATLGLRPTLSGDI